MKHLVAGACVALVAGGAVFASGAWGIRQRADCRGSAGARDVTWGGGARATVQTSGSGRARQR